MRREELEGIKGKAADGKARTRMAMLGCVFTQHTEDEEGRPLRVILRVKTSHLFAGENQPPLRRFFHNIILSFCKRVETDFYCSWIVFGLDCRYLNGG